MIGREQEIQYIETALRLGRSLIIEGPVGVGKTHLASAICQNQNRQMIRIDGDNRYSEQKLTGWFDPPLALKHGYGPKSFVEGPLVRAMQSGSVLFINELNRLPEGVQNVLLPAIDEGRIEIPRIGLVEASSGFVVLATQNPKEFVATTHLSEALMDRFDILMLDYQSRDHELQIVQHYLSEKGLNDKAQPSIVEKSVDWVRQTRNPEKFKRGASVRASMGLAEMTIALMEDHALRSEEAFEQALQMVLPTRLEMEQLENQTEPGTKEWIAAMKDRAQVQKKKL